ncbi:MAG: zinc-binding alcohol dehydrogenase family protein [Clostridiales bacterium]|nr:zinc-binding alcohol dehydrogenase family protein [Clostridiales bacterium]
MKAVLVERPMEIRIVDVPKPEIKRDDEVLVKVCSGGICGSDIGIYRGTNALATYPRIIGHEFGGIVEAVGISVSSVRVGDHVAVDPVRACGHCYACTHGFPNVCAKLEVCGVHRDGGFSEYVVAPAKDVYAVDPAGIPLEHLCAIEPYSIGAEVSARASISADDSVLVMGSGPIGNCIMQVARAKGARVMMTDLLDARLERAVDMGADRVVNTTREDLKTAVLDFTQGEGMPVVVDSICQDWSLDAAIQLTCPAARVVALGTSDKVSSIRQLDIVKKELTVVGSRLNNRRFPEVIKLMSAGKLTPDKLCTSIHPFTQIEHALDRAINHQDEECKVTLSFT